MTTLAIALWLAVAPSGVQARDAGDGPAIVAQGEATVQQPADMASLQIAVESRAGRPEDARQQAAAAMTSVLAALRKLVPADAIKTSIFSVQPEMEYPNGTPRVKGYLARNQLEVRVDELDKLAAVMDASVSSGATTVAGLRFDVKKRDEIERSALGLAVKDATERARAMAAGAGRALGELVRIQEQRVSGGPMLQKFTMQPSGVAGRAATPTPVTPGDIEIRAEVTATFAIR